MNSLLKLSKLVSFLVVCLFVASCSSRSSRSYKPLPKWEKQFHDIAKKDLSPSNIRQSPSKKNKMVAWTGIIKDISAKKAGSDNIVHFKVDHRDFDWKESGTVDTPQYELAPKGDGEFEFTWVFKTNKGLAFTKQFQVGDMVLAYGYPILSEPSTPSRSKIGLHPVYNIRALKGSSPVKTPQMTREDRFRANFR